MKNTKEFGPKHASWTAVLNVHTELVLSMYVKLCVCVCVCVFVCVREITHFEDRGLSYKALWLSHSNSDAPCFPWWDWTKPNLGTVWLWWNAIIYHDSAFYGSPLPLSSGIKMCNKRLQQKKRNIIWNVYYTHTHDIHAKGQYCNPTVYVCTVYVQRVLMFSWLFWGNIYVFLNTKLFLFY